MKVSEQVHTFPKDFLWGTATSAHQTEGNNTNSDWWGLEQNKSRKNKWPLEPSGIAADSYNRYEEDFDLCVKLNNNAVRISVEWARIEPEEGKFSKEAFEHYRKVLKAAKDRGLKTFVTLHHFSNPLWLAKKGAWVNFATPKLFAKYAAKCAKEFDDLVDAYMTLNEALAFIQYGYLKAAWPPQKFNPLLVPLAVFNTHRGHIMAYQAIKRVRNVDVGLVKNIAWFQTHPHKKSFLDVAISGLLNYLNRDYNLRPERKNADFIGLNYYFSFYIKNLRAQTPNEYRSDMGTWVNPKGLENMLVYLKKYNVPIYVTENGIADAKDKLRAKFIRGHLIACSRAIQQGVNLKGYFHWSLIDNYEWHEGFWPKFGLVEIDRQNNLARKPRMSFYYYAHICKNNAVV